MKKRLYCGGAELTFISVYFIFFLTLTIFFAFIRKQLAETVVCAVFVLLGVVFISFIGLFVRITDKGIQYETLLGVKKRAYSWNILNSVDKIEVHGKGVSVFIVLNFSKTNISSMDFINDANETYREYELIYIPASEMNNKQNAKILNCISMILADRPEILSKFDEVKKDICD